MIYKQLYDKKYKNPAAIVKLSEKKTIDTWLPVLVFLRKMSEEGIDVKFEKQLKTQQVLDIINKLMKQS